MDIYRPMIALNVYLLPEFRQDILRTVVSGVSDLPEELRHAVIAAIRDEVKVSGFRNPFSAPHSVLVRRMETVFLKQSRFVKVILKAWAGLHQDIELAVSPVIRALSFQKNDQQPEYPDPEKAFLTGWPENLTYEKLTELIRAQDPKITAGTDDLALMTVWLSGCLPDPTPAGENA